MSNKKTYILDLPSQKWTTFKGLDIISNCILSGGQRLDNVNLFLDTTGHTKMYPDDTNGVRTSEDALIKKEIKFYYVTLRDITVDYIDKLISGTATINITTKNSVNDFEKVNSITITSNDNVMKRHDLPLGNYGDKIELILTNFDKIRNVIITINMHNTRR